jgi:hypothetical protein
LFGDGRRAAKLVIDTPQTINKAGFEIQLLLSQFKKQNYPNEYTNFISKALSDLVCAVLHVIRKDFAYSIVICDDVSRSVCQRGYYGAVIRTQSMFL